MTSHVAQLLERFRPRRRAAVVVEIGTDLIKILRQRDAHPVINMVKIADCKQPLEEELPALLHAMGIARQPVTTYLPRKLVTMRFLEIPSTDEDEIAEMMRLQGIKQTPYSPEEVAMAHAVVGSRHEGMSDVVLAFCQRKFVEERVELLGRSGLSVERVAVSTEGVINWYLRNAPATDSTAADDLIALIDQDLSFSDVVFCRDGRFVYSKGILSGGHQLVMEPEQGIERFCQEVKLAIDFTMDEAKLAAPKQVILLASLEADATLRTALEARLGIPVTVRDPSQTIDIPSENLVKGGSVAGLVGFRQDKADLLFELMPEDMKLRRALEKRGVQMMTTALLAIGLLAAIGFLIAGNFYKKKEYARTLAEEITKTQEYATSIEEKLARTRLIEKVKNPQTSVLNYLKQAADTLTSGVYFNSIDFSADSQIVLKGNAAQMADVFAFAKALEELKLFKGVKSERVSKKKDGDQTIAEFEIKCLLN
ncbi:MAG: pilus assembly protein PilM [Deltaproteobacteria bacterium]|nr:pilus assembly protein PilM [Deltaproteobacteria bacterium]